MKHAAGIPGISLFVITVRTTTQTNVKHWFKHCVYINNTHCYKTVT